MKVARKLLITGGATLVLAGGALALPVVTTTAGAASPDRMRGPDHSQIIKQDTNASFSVKTGLDSYHHVLWSTVTNKSTTSLTPTVTFNDRPSIPASNKQLEPGKSKTFVHFLNGNDFTVTVKIAAPGADTLASVATINFKEPVSFRITDANKDTVTGTLFNNTNDPQTVYLKEHRKDTTTQNLNPGEARTVTIPASIYHPDNDKRHGDKDQKFIHITLTTKAGFRSSYTIPLGPIMFGD